VDHQPIPLTYIGTHDTTVDKPDDRVDALTAKTLFASDLIAANKAWAEKEVSRNILSIEY
jgi:hypothetical protein